MSGSLDTPRVEAPAAALAAAVPAAWRAALSSTTDSAAFASLAAFVADERARGPVYPPARDTFAALEAVAPEDVRAVILGQDPYHGEGQAHGLAFSVPPGVRVPPSLHNILRELASDLGVARPASGCLTSWAQRGVLLANTLWTVRAGEPQSHRGVGWERFTDAVLRAVNEQPRPIAFLLWGAPAQGKRALVDESRHVVIACAHPSPLSASRGFLGSKPFSRANALLQARGAEPVDWRL